MTREVKKYLSYDLLIIHKLCSTLNDLIGWDASNFNSQEYTMLNMSAVKIGVEWKLKILALDNHRSTKITPSQASTSANTARDHLYFKTAEAIIYYTSSKFNHIEIFPKSFKDMKSLSKFASCPGMLLFLLW